MPVPLANQVLEHVRGERQLLIGLLEELTAAESPSKHPDIHDRIRTSLVKTTAEMAERGMFSRELLSEIQATVSEYRSANGAPAASGTQE